MQGSSVKLLKEEKERKLFKRKNERLCYELADKIKEWERERGEKFLVRGLPYLDHLTAEIESLQARGDTKLVKSDSRDKMAAAPAGASAEATPAEATARKPVRPSTRPASGTARRRSTESSSERSRKLEEWRAQREAKK